ncbi:MAG: hypothetical protein U5O69_02000 [Candidatus Competibacteraceae bacterium]|nr:hypothetical protein [Candidatus Competibacteraceae bacterium]
MSSIVRRFHCPSPPRRWRWSALFLLWMLPFAVPAQISDAKVEALVEALRLSAPPVDADSGLYSDWGIKPDNIARWSQRCLERDLTPEQFAADRALARRVLVCVMGPVLREQFAAGRNEIVAAQRAAAWWMTGDPDQYREGATDAYTLRVLEAYLRFF